MKDLLNTIKDTSFTLFIVLLTIGALAFFLLPFLNGGCRYKTVEEKMDSEGKIYTVTVCNTK